MSTSIAEARRRMFEENKEPERDRDTGRKGKEKVDAWDDGGRDAMRNGRRTDRPASGPSRARADENDDDNARTARRTRDGGSPAGGRGSRRTERATPQPVDDLGTPPVYRREKFLLDKDQGRLASGREDRMVDVDGDGIADMTYEQKAAAGMHIWQGPNRPHADEQRERRRSRRRERKAREEEFEEAIASGRPRSVPTSSRVPLKGDGDGRGSRGGPASVASSRISLAGGGGSEASVAALVQDDFENAFADEEFEQAFAQRSSKILQANRENEEAMGKTLLSRERERTGVSGTGPRMIVRSASASTTASRALSNLKDQKTVVLKEISKRTSAEDIQYEIVPYWETRIREVVGHTVPIAVDWASFERASNIDRAVDMLRKHEGELVFARVTMAIEDLCHEFGDAKRLISQGLTKVLVKLASWGGPQDIVKPERCFLESVTVGQRKFKPRDMEKVMRMTRIDPNDPETAALLSKHGQMPINPKTALTDKFVLKLHCNFDSESKCFTQAEIKHAFQVAFGFTQNNPFERVREMLIPRYESQIVEEFGHAIPIDVKWTSFHENKEHAKALETIERNGSELVLARIAGAMIQIAEQYPDGRAAISARLVRIVVKCVPASAISAKTVKVVPLDTVRAQRGEYVSKYEQQQPRGYFDPMVPGGNDYSQSSETRSSSASVPGMFGPNPLAPRVRGGPDQGSRLQPPLVLKIYGMFERAEDGCPSVAMIKHHLLTALSLHYLPADVKYSVAPMWEEQMRQLLPRYGTLPLIHIDWESFEHAENPEAAMLTLHHETGELVFSRIFAALRDVAQYPHGQQKLLESLVRVRIKHLPGMATGGMKCEVRPVVLVPEGLENYGGGTVTQMPMASTGDGADMPDLTGMTVEKPPKASRSSLCELKILCAFEAGEAGVFSTAYMKYVLLSALRVDKLNPSQEIKDFLAPMHEESIRGVLGVPVFFDINWASIEDSDDFHVALQTLHHNRGDNVFRRVADAIEDLEHMMGSERIREAAKGFVAVHVQNTPAELIDERECYIEELDTIRDSRLEELSLARKYVSTVQKRRVEAQVAANMSHAEHVEAAELDGEVYAVSSLMTPQLDLPARMQRRFILRIETPLEMGSKACFSVEAIRHVLEAAFKIQLARGRFLETISYQLIPTWEGELRQLLGRTMPIMLDWKSFERARDFAKAMDTLAHNGGEYLLKRIVEALGDVCKRNPKAITKINKYLHGIVVKVAPVTATNAVHVGLHDISTPESALVPVNFQWGTELRKAQRPVRIRSALEPEVAEPEHQLWERLPEERRQGASRQRRSADGGPAKTAAEKYSKLMHRTWEATDDEPDTEEGKAIKKHHPKFLLKITVQLELGERGVVPKSEIVTAMMDVFGATQKSTLDRIKEQIMPENEQAIFEACQSPVRFAVDWDSLYKSKNVAAAIKMLAANDGDDVFGRVREAIVTLCHNFPQARLVLAQKLDFVSIKLVDHSDAMHCKVKEYLDADQDFYQNGALRPVFNAYGEQQQNVPGAYVPPAHPKVVLKLALAVGKGGLFSQEEIYEVLLRGLSLDQRVMLEVVRSLLSSWEQRLYREVGSFVSMQAQFETFSRLANAEIALETVRLAFARVVGAVSEVCHDDPKNVPILAKHLGAIRFKNSTTADHRKLAGSTASGSDAGGSKSSRAERAEKAADDGMSISLKKLGDAYMHHAASTADWVLSVRAPFADGPAGCPSQHEIKAVLVKELGLSSIDDEGNIVAGRGGPRGEGRRTWVDEMAVDMDGDGIPDRPARQNGSSSRQGASSRFDRARSGRERSGMTPREARLARQRASEHGGESQGRVPYSQRRGGSAYDDGDDDGEYQRSSPRGKSRQGASSAVGSPQAGRSAAADRFASAAGRVRDSPADAIVSGRGGSRHDGRPMAQSARTAAGPSRFPEPQRVASADGRAAPQRRPQPRGSYAQQF